MRQPIDPIRITGLRDLQAQLKALDGESQKQLRLVLNRAAEIVAAGARAKAPVRTGAYQSTIKVASSQREARVKAGSARVPYAGFLDFGGAVGRNKSVHRTFISQGRYVYPTYYAHQPQILDVLTQGLSTLITTAGLEET